MDRRVVAASGGSAVVMALTCACATGTPRAEHSGAMTAPPRPMASVVSASPDHGVMAKARLPAPGPVNRPSDGISRLIDRLQPERFVLNSSGHLLISYGDPVNGAEGAWRLYGPRNDLLAEGHGGAGAAVAGPGFLLFDQGVTYLDTRGRLSKVTLRESLRRPATAGDVVVPDLERTFDPRRLELFAGTAVPDGLVSHQDDRGRLWALADTAGRTVVRHSSSGGTWTSQDLGPRIGARRVTGAGRLLMVTGRVRMYLSQDGGRTWRSLVHGAAVYSGIPEFTVTPDGSIVAGDERAGWRVSHDLLTFRDATTSEAVSALRRVTTRGAGAAAQLSVDGVHWQTFSVLSLRCLLRGGGR